MQTITVLDSIKKPGANSRIVCYSTRDGPNREDIVQKELKDYFFVLKGERANPEFAGDSWYEEGDWHDLKGRPLDKINVEGLDYHQKKFLISLFTDTFEADVPAIQKFVYDNDVQFGDSIRVAWLDIETDTKGGFSNVGNPFQPITAITVADSFTGKYHILSWKEDGTGEYKNETAMLQAFFNTIRNINPDAYCGWNSNAYDIPYIIARCEKIGMSAEKLSPYGRVFLKKDSKSEKTKYIPYVKGVMCLDLFLIYRKIRRGELQSHKLDYVAKEEGLQGKTKIKGSIGKMWRENYEQFLEYNKNDVELCIEIDKRVKGIDYVLMLRKTAFLHNPMDCIINSKMVDSYILKNKDPKLKLPTATYKGTGDLEGGYVKDSKAGVYKNVIVLDLRSLYPNIMISCNMSSEMKLEEDDGDCINVKGVLFSKKSVGFVPTMLKDLQKIREELVRQMKTHAPGSAEYNRLKSKQHSFKTILNSYYGVAGYAKYRLYDLDIAGSITLVGRMLREQAEKVALDMGFQSVAGDTDSTFVKLPDEYSREECLRTAGYLINAINESYGDFVKKEYNIDKHVISIDYKKLYSNIFFTGAKKKYAGTVTDTEGKACELLDIVGFEAKRSDSPKFFADLQKEMFKAILSGKDNKTAWLKIRESEKKIKTLPVSQLGIPKAIKKPFGDYKVKPIWVRAAEHSNKYLGTEYEGGTKGLMVYVSRIPADRERTNVIMLDEDSIIPEGYEVDFPLMKEKWIDSKMKQLFEPLGWRTDFQQTILGEF